MIMHTASEGITFARGLENDSAKFYEEAARRNATEAETFLSFARDNNKNIAQIERAYYGVITDAIEGCFAFDLDSDNYILKTAISDGAKFTDVIRQALQMEEKIIKFYQDTTEQSKSLMADVPRTFMLVARQREKRQLKLKALLQEAGS